MEEKRKEEKRSQEKILENRIKRTEDKRRDMYKNSLGYSGIFPVILRMLGHSWLDSHHAHVI